MAVSFTGDTISDAIVVLPGIMGSELVEVRSGRVLWGFAPGWYASAWTSGRSLRALRVTDAERTGQVGRIQATRLLQSPACAPVLRGIEPYHGLVAGLKRLAADPSAVLEFPYDWRLSIEHNAAELAKATEIHLRRWRAHPRGTRDARLVLVAHSMGGLVARYFTEVLGGDPDVRTTVTLGTPFYGSVKAAVILSTGRGSPLPLPRARLRALAVTMPGLSDLLPSYRCVDVGTTSRRLAPGDIAGLGGDPELASAAWSRRDRVLSGGASTLRAIAGVQQKTPQSLRLADGVAEALFYTCEEGPLGGPLRRTDYRGDSTVYQHAAVPAGLEVQELSQTHSALAKGQEAIRKVRDLLTGRRPGPPLGVTNIGVDVPNVVTTGEPFPVAVDTVNDPAEVGVCRIIDVNTNMQVAAPVLRRRDGILSANQVLSQPGQYRVEVTGGSGSPVTQLVLAVPPSAPRMADEDDPWT